MPVSFTKNDIIFDHISKINTGKVLYCKNVTQKAHYLDKKIIIVYHDYQPQRCCIASKNKPCSVSCIFMLFAQPLE